MSTVSLVAQPYALVGESVRMDGDDVLWLDPPQRRLLRWSPSDGSLCEIALAVPIWSLGRRPDGSWVAAGEEGFHVIDVSTGALSAGPPAPLAPGCRLNDMTIDAQGGLWAGSMHRGLLSGRGALYYAPDAHASVTRVADGLGVANGMAFRDGGTTLLVVDTLSRTLLAYPREGVSVLAEPFVITDFLAIPGKPDGMAIDAEGWVWVAMWGGGCIVRLAPNGAVEQMITLPAPHVGSLAFDGDGKAYVGTSRARLTDAAIEANPGSGGLFRVRVGE
ncbi:SMP-30/gluconolactonase/LRE family protein [Pinirhizobacter sp.]|jgi:sugar lactone lactonase YvrE|uniref:SMP-30/gluconolactonase/LRE family protein n=1 Tax=Pinirhizobacter sp. TaxID=2950432 RepID=UPI002F3F01C0